MDTGSSVKTLIFLGIIALIMFIVGKIYSKFKWPKVGSLVMVNGGLKTGKSTFAFGLAYKNYLRNLRVWKIRVFFQKLLNRKLDEMPLFYSNIPCNVPHVRLTQDLILMKKRFRFKSVVFIDEASLMADSQLYSDKKINEQLLVFVKTFGHITHGGSMIFNSQAVSDLHYAFKRCLAEYIYIHHLEKHIPFFLVAKVREERYSDDGSVVNAYNSDVEDDLKRVLIRKKTWKLFDCYAFSFLTDDKPVEDRVIDVKSDDLKARELLSFRRFINEQFKKWQEADDSGKDNNRRSTSVSTRDSKCGEVDREVSHEVQDQSGRRVGDGADHKGAEEDK